MTNSTLTPRENQTINIQGSLITIATDTIATRPSLLYALLDAQGKGIAFPAVEYGKLIDIMAELQELCRHLAPIVSTLSEGQLDRLPLLIPLAQEVAKAVARTAPLDQSTLTGVIASLGTAEWAQPPHLARLVAFVHSISPFSCLCPSAHDLHTQLEQKKAICALISSPPRTCPAAARWSD